MNSTAISDQSLQNLDGILNSIASHLTPEMRYRVLEKQLAPSIKTDTEKTQDSLVLHCDFLRIIVDLIDAYDQVSQDELRQNLPILQNVSGFFSRVRPEYASYSTLSPLNALNCLRLYKSDKLLTEQGKREWEDGRI